MPGLWSLPSVVFSTAGKDGEPVKMPWGKHKGEELEDVPTDYMEWCLREMNSLNEALAQEMESQIRMRAGEGVSRGRRG